MYFDLAQILLDPHQWRRATSRLVFIGSHTMRRLLSSLLTRGCSTPHSQRRRIRSNRELCLPGPPSTIRIGHGVWRRSRDDPLLGNVGGKDPGRPLLMLNHSRERTRRPRSGGQSYLGYWHASRRCCELESGNPPTVCASNRHVARRASGSRRCPLHIAMASRASRNIVSVIATCI